jgi:hypothetical protein
MQTYLGQRLIQLPTIRSSFTVHLHIVIGGTRRDLCKRGSARHSADESRDIRDLSAENASPVKGPRESWNTWGADMVEDWQSTPKRWMKE